MVLSYLSAIWAAVAPELANHLWQSTLCLAAAGLLTLALRKNRAEVRYGLWLAAAVKFLIPFSLLVAVGMHLAPPKPQPRTTASGFYFVMEEVSRPFSQASRGLQRATESRRPWEAGLRYQLVRALPAGIAGLWLSGFLAFLGLWCIRWRRMTKMLRGATPLQQGREVEALRRAERLAGIRRPIELILSPASLEPGIFGIITPVLVWPRRISERLDDGQLEAILAHELWHVRRWDNLAAAIHMVVEALFWFHPLVWWLGARLVEERERACDEAVLRLGNQREVYAESILKTCEFCLESPLACVSGVTGADLKERIVRIMAQGRTNALTFPRRLLLVVVGMAAVAGPVMFGLLKVPRARAQSSPTTGTPAASFEVAAIKPNRSGDWRVMMGFGPGRFRATGMWVRHLITLAYDVRDFQVTGGPSWIDSERYDIQAKEPDSVAAEMQKLSQDQREELSRSMLQSLLADRFKLKLGHETKELPAYALVVAKGGPKLQAAKPDADFRGIKGPEGRGQRGKSVFGMGDLTIRDEPLSMLARMLSQQLGRPVLDQTGLEGKYDFTLKWTPGQGEGMIGMGPGGGGPEPGKGMVGREPEDGSPQLGSPPAPDMSGPSIFTAIQEQLGLKLESTKGPVEILVVDHVERPTEN
jgi:bla regulator protein blaR1